MLVCQHKFVSAIPLLLARLKRREDFVRLARKGRHWVTTAFVLHCDSRPDGSTLRVGFTASRRIGKAVERNRAKRRLRAVAEEVLSLNGQAGFDYVLVARHNVLTKEFETLKKDLEWALKKIHAEPLY